MIASLLNWLPVRLAAVKLRSLMATTPITLMTRLYGLTCAAMIAIIKWLVVESLVTQIQIRDFYMIWQNKWFPNGTRSHSSSGSYLGPILFQIECSHTAPMKKMKPDQEPQKPKEAFSDPRSEYFPDGSAIVYREDGSMLLIEASTTYDAGKPTKSTKGK